MNDPFAAIASILAGRSREKPWLTASGIERRLRRAQGEPGLSAAEIHRLLVTHAQQPDRCVRHSAYPSRRLDDLWGHVANVGEHQSLPDLDRTDDHLEPEAPEQRRDHPLCFLSHSHRDLARALEIRRVLEEAGIGAWIFESEIARGDRISVAVKRAIEESSVFLAYVTRRALGSLWVHKELLVAGLVPHLQPVLVVDGGDPDLLAALAANAVDPSSAEEVTERMARLSAEATGSRTSSPWAARCKSFLRAFRDYLGGSSCVALHPALPPDQDPPDSLDTCSLEDLARDLQSLH